MAIAFQRRVFDLQIGLVSRLEAKIFCFEKNIFETRAFLMRFVLSISSAKNDAIFARRDLISEQKTTN